MASQPRVVCWWSAGVCSAVAARMALDQAGGREVVIAYCDTSGTEHPDNLRFLADCERWYGQSIVRLRSSDYEDTWDVWRRTKFLYSVRGARCTTELKKKVRRDFQWATDIQVFGFSAEEERRATRFSKNNFEVTTWFPLIEGSVSKASALLAVKAAGIEIPEMYRLGYKNNNCIGCVKGGIGYWNKIREDFPEHFARMARLERELGMAVLKDRRGGEPKPLYLDELSPHHRGSYASEPGIECGAACETSEQDPPEGK